MTRIREFHVNPAGQLESSEYNPFDEGQLLFTQQMFGVCRDAAIAHANSVVAMLRASPGQRKRTGLGWLELVDRNPVEWN